MREILLREVDITLEKATQLCVAAETTKAQIKKMHEEDLNVQASARESKQVDAVKHKQTRKKDQQHKTKVSEKDKASTFDCKRCGTEHTSRSCPAYGKQCKNCKKMNHFARMCRSRKVHAVDDDVTDQQASPFVGAVHANTQSHAEEWTIEMKLEHKTVKFKLDTGCTGQCNSLQFTTENRQTEHT